MRTGFLKGVALGAVVASMVCVATAAVAGTGIGATLNLGQTNKVNGNTNLTNVGSGPALGLVVQPGQTPLHVNSGTRVDNLNVDKLDSIDSLGFVQGGGKVRQAHLELPSGGAAVILTVAGFSDYLVGCGASGTSIFARNKTNPVQSVDFTWVTNAAAGYSRVMTTSAADGVYVALNAKPDVVTTVHVYRPGHLMTVVLSAHWSAAECFVNAQAIQQ